VGRRPGRRAGRKCGHGLGGRSLKSWPLLGGLAVGGGLVAAVGAPSARLRVAARAPAIGLLAVVGAPYQTLRGGQDSGGQTPGGG
jgi:hypothetical protein